MSSQEAKRGVLGHGRLSGTQATPGRKQGRQLVQDVKERLRAVRVRLDEESQAMERGETRVEDLAWEDELEPHAGKHR